jgi:ABC-type lipopolysaccharide export system ATPase subunit
LRRNPFIAAGVYGSHMLEARKLTKRYAAIPVLQNVSFIIRPGEILGYLGPTMSSKRKRFAT